MADKAVSELIEAERITPTDLFVLEQNGTAKKLTGQVLLNWLTAAADGHGGIQYIQKVSTSGLMDTYRITLADTTAFDFVVSNGKGVSGVAKTDTNGLVDTYTISYNDGLTSTFTVTNGAQGPKGDNQYVWIKYASQQPTASSHSFGDVPDNWIGIYSGGSATAPADWQQYKWFQIKGKQGDPGVPATLTGSKVEYQVSDSGTIIPSGAWSASVPVVAQGKYLWTRTTNTFNTGAPVVSYIVARMGLDGSGSVSSVANIPPDAGGNIPLTAQDLGALPSGGGDMTGELNMNGQPISGLNAPTSGDQAANKSFVNQQVKKASPRNLLDNSNFRNPVNQRGQTSYSSGGYTVDRWGMYATTTMTVSVEEGGLRLDNTNGPEDSASAVFHRFDDKESKLLGGKAVTIAVCDENGTITVAAGTLSASDVSSNTAQFAHISADKTFYINAYKRSSTQCFEIRINVYAGKTVTIKWAALYEGEYTAETLPEYQPKGYGAELAECKRYFEVVMGGCSAPAHPYNATTFAFVLDYAEKRIVPTITFSTPYTDVIAVFGIGSNTPTSITPAEPIGLTSARINCVGTFDMANVMAFMFPRCHAYISADL